MKNIFWKLAVAVLVLLARAPLRAAETNAPMPMDKLILRVLERAQKEDDNDNRFKSRYCFTRSKSQETRNGKGDLKKREAGTGTNDPAVFALQLAAKKKTEKKSLTINGGRATESDSSVQGRAFEPGDFPMGQDLMGRFDFKVVGHETLHGRPTTIIEFKPANKKLPERNLKDKFINKAAGRVWVDDEEFAVAKADLYLSEKVSVFGGLVGSVGKFTYVLERERAEPGPFSTRRSAWHLEGREVIFRRVIDFHEEVTDVHLPGVAAGK